MNNFKKYFLASIKVLLVVLGLSFIFGMIVIGLDYLTKIDNDNVKINMPPEAVIEEIQGNLDHNDIQVLTALGKNNGRAKLELIRSKDLKADGLVALCSNPLPLNMDNNQICYAFESAIKNTKMTAKHEKMIAELGGNTYVNGLLSREELTSEGLDAIAHNLQYLNLENRYLIKRFEEAFKRVKTRPEDEVDIAKLKVYVLSKSLMLKDDISSEGLVAVCENAECFNLENSENQKIFKKAIDRTELTLEQKRRIAVSKIGGLGLFD